MKKEYLSAQTMPSGYVLPIDKKDWAPLLAEFFCYMNSEEQALFFNKIAEIDRRHWERKGVFQWRSMQDNLTPQARQVIVDIYEHTGDE